MSEEGLIRAIHNSPVRFVLALAGGGSQAVADLLAVPGASRSILEVIVPYSPPAMVALLGGPPDQACSPETARAMAVASFERARHYGAADDAAAGVSCTASLASDRPKRGSHRVHVALQTAGRTATWSLELLKGHRSRLEEEELTGLLVLRAVAAACEIERCPDVSLLEGEHIDFEEVVAPESWRALRLGQTAVIAAAGEAWSPAAAILPGAFNPWHAGHQRMVETAQEFLGTPIAAEISIHNVDKPSLDYFEIRKRLGQFPPGQTVLLTRAATFEEKSRLFPGATFVVGVDTLARIADARYYGGDPVRCRRALRNLAAAGCRFLVFGRLHAGGFLRLADLDLPAVLRRICREVPPDIFRHDISSTSIRQSAAEAAEQPISAESAGPAETDDRP